MDFLCQPKGIYDRRLRGDYEQGKLLELVSNAILYWNTIKINDIVENLKQQGEDIDDETLSHISLLPFRHVLPNGTYFIEIFRAFERKPTVVDLSLNSKP